MKPEYRVIIAGTRDFDDYGLLCRHTDYKLSVKRTERRIVIVSGAAKGADALGEQYARERGYKLVRYSADWEKYGKAAGPIRNDVMARNADALIAYWDGRSPGTWNMIQTARNYGLKVSVKRYAY